MLDAYFSEIQKLLDEVLTTQRQSMEQTAQELAKRIKERNNIYIFGCSHASILAQELFYRTGGLAVINPILAPGLTLDVRPVTATTQLERLDGYAKVVLSSTDLKKGDLLIIHSVSGRNAVPVEMAIEAKKMGAFVVALTNVKYSNAFSSRAAGGKRLCEVCDLVIDNCGSVGDAVCEIESFPERVAASSTVIGAAILNAILAQTVKNLVEIGVTPPVFLSANIDGGDAHNARMLQEYKDNIKYM